MNGTTIRRGSWGALILMLSLVLVMSFGLVSNSAAGSPDRQPDPGGSPQTSETTPSDEIDIRLIPGTVDVHEDVKSAVLVALLTGLRGQIEANDFAITDVREVDQWLFVSTIGLNGLGPDLQWNLLDNGSWFGLVLLRREPNSLWSGALQGTPAFSDLLAQMPDNLLSQDAKLSMDPLQREEIAATSSYRFPWQTGTSMQYGPFGIHDNGFPSVVSGWKAVDFLSDGNTGAGHAPNRLLTAASGTISYKCAPATGETTTALRVGDLMYTHLLNSANLYVGRSFSQGEEVGQLRPGSFTEKCGNSTLGNLGPEWFHVHWGFPNSGSFEAGGWTLLFSDQLWHRGAETKAVNSWLLAEDTATPCTNPSPNSDQIALYEHSDYCGSYKILGIGEYPNPGAMGFANDTASSVKVGANVKATLCRDDNYGGGCEDLTGDDTNLTDNGIGNDTVSSVKVQPRTTPCNPSADQVAIYADANYGGACALLGMGDYPNPGYLGSVGNDDAESIRVGGNVKATLYEHDNYAGRAETFTGDDSNLGDNSIGANQVSSVKVGSRVTPQPDLRPFTSSGYTAPVVPSSMQGTHAPNTLLANAVTFFDWHFVNSGSGVAIGNFHVELWIDTQRYIRYPYSNFGVGQEGGFDDWAIGDFTPGLHTVRLVVDPDNTVAESDESNNIWEQQFYWQSISGWKGEYFNNPELSGAPWLTRDDTALDFDWGLGSPDPALPSDFFSVRWTRVVTFQGGNYRFHMRHDDGARLYLDDVLRINAWGTCCVEDTLELSVSAGDHTVRMEMYEGGGAAHAALWWELLSITPPFLMSPADGAVIARTDGIGFLWSGSLGATEYYAEFWGGPNVSINSGWTPNVYWQIGSQWAGTYQWRVKARNGANESGWSATYTLKVKYGSPTGLTASVVSQSQINLAWSPSADAPGNIDGYRIYRDGAPVATVGSSITSYGDTGLNCGVTYNYSVKAYKGTEESDPSNTVSQSTSACTQPSDLIVESISFSPTSPTLGQPVAFTVRIKNQGPGTTNSGFWLDFYLDHQPTGCGDYNSVMYWSVPALAGGATAEFTYTHPGFASAGAHSAWAFVDSGCGVGESAENNNLAGPTTVTVIDPDLIFADGFESGSLSAWSSSTTDGGDLSVRTGAALVGSYGLRATLDDNVAIYVTDDRPNAEPRYRARFYHDPNSIKMSSGDAHYIFYGYKGTSTVVLRVEFRRSSGSYQLRAALVDDGSTWKTSSWYTISDAPHYVELDWKASTASGADNGYLTLWIDGVQKANLTGVDNDTRRIDRVRLGAVNGIDSGTRGTTFFDAFESRKQNPVGAASAAAAEFEVGESAEVPMVEPGSR